MDFADKSGAGPQEARVGGHDREAGRGDREKESRKESWGGDSAARTVNQACVDAPSPWLTRASVRCKNDSQTWDRTTGPLALQVSVVHNLLFDTKCHGSVAQRESVTLKR